MPAGEVGEDSGFSHGERSGRDDGPPDRSVAAPEAPRPERESGMVPFSRRRRASP